jgi:site-specific DNA-methyltransferase (adenine-specific)
VYDHLALVGSGTLPVAAKNLGRKYIGIDNDKNYIKIAKKRISGEGKRLI